jgi:hypothetical protein
VIVILDVLVDACVKLIQVVKFVQIKKFGLQCAEETLHGRVVIAVTRCAAILRFPEMGLRVAARQAMRNAVEGISLTT